MKRILLDENQRKSLKEILSKFETYSSFSNDKDAAYSFTNIIGVKVCPYCNIEYTYTVYNKKRKHVLRPDIDHFVPKNKKTGNPKLQLEFTNLIPSCLVCNERLKRNKYFSRNENIHPYYDDFDSIMEFCVRIKNLDYLNENSFDIVFLPRENVTYNDIKRANNNINVFKLNERYSFHKNEVVMIFKRIRYYNDSKLREINRLIEPKKNLSMIFPEQDCNINSVSLGKLKKDIIHKYCK
ncbi:MAG TPA: hypothetical protein DDW20_06135 [Firmicutes bacterium]|nr:hypothetical protein [Bacillota bacterium]